MGPTPQWCETAIRSANGGTVFAASGTDFEVTPLKRSRRESRSKDGSCCVSTARRNGAPRTQERLDVSLAARAGILLAWAEPEPGDAGMTGGGS